MKGKSQTPSAGLAARSAAQAILLEVLGKRRALDIAASEILSKAGLEERDAGFARAIAYETMRRYGQLQDVLRRFVPKPLAPHRAGTALEILLAGSCELLFLNVAPHAVVDAANRLAEADRKTVHFKGLLNAVLRRVAREGATALSQQDQARAATPDWLWTRWSAQYGEETARAIAGAHLLRPPLDLTLKALGDPCPDLPDATRLTPGHLRLGAAGRVERLPGYAEGRWWVQDFAASLPVQLMGDVSGKDVIELCAAPGGKTAQLASRGAKVTAVDRSAERLALVEENLVRLGLNTETIVADARDWRPMAPIPFVFLDAPCTATGTIRRHPELPWIKSAADIVTCQNLQRELLNAAAKMTAPGGTLLYSVCSLESEEGVEQVEHFVGAHPNFKRSRWGGEDVPDIELLSREGDLRTFPHHWSDKGGMDGFYAARLVRER